MLVLSLLAEDTLHLLEALASTGGDSLSLSALWIFLFRSWNMSWWRFRVCIIFYTGTLHVTYKINTTACHQFFVTLLHFISLSHISCLLVLWKNRIEETKITSKSSSAYRDFRLWGENETERLQMCLENSGAPMVHTIWDSGRRETLTGQRRVSVGQSDPTCACLLLTDSGQMTFKSLVMERWRKAWPSDCWLPKAAAPLHVSLGLKTPAGRFVRRAVLAAVRPRPAAPVSSRKLTTAQTPFTVHVPKEAGEGFVGSCLCEKPSRVR